MPQILPPKKDVALALLERASVFVHLDPRGDALVPLNFKKQPRLVLQIGLNMAVPIPDLRLDDHGMSCTLSFNRAKFHCVVPWPAVFALVGEDGRGMVWPDDVPREIAGEMGPRDSAHPQSGGPQAERPALAAAPNPQPTGPAIVVKKKPHVSLVGAPGQTKSPRKRGGSRKQDKPALVSVPKAKPPVALPPIDLAAEKADKADKAQKAEKAAAAASASQTPNASAPSAKKDDAPAAAPKKKSPKRELPPYLRVVK